MMTRILATGRDHALRVLEGRNDETLMVTLRDAGLGLAAICGGVMACATCHVYVAEAEFAKLPSASEDEQAMLEDLDDYRAKCSRLSCQITLQSADGDFHVEIAPEQ